MTKVWICIVLIECLCEAERERERDVAHMQNKFCNNNFLFTFPVEAYWIMPLIIVGISKYTINTPHTNMHMPNTACNNNFTLPVEKGGGLDCTYD